MLLKRLGVLGLLPLLLSCRSAAEEKGRDRPSDTGEVRLEVLGVRVHELAVLACGEIEAAADEISERSSDPQIQHRALLWKTNAIPAFQVACFRQPLGGLLDAWAISSQMERYFREGAGKDLFGGEQEIALQTSARLEREAQGVAATTLAPEELATWQSFMADWTEKNPLEGLHFARRSPIAELADQSRGPNGLFEIAGSLERQLTEISKRVNLYLRQMPKQARWQAELLASSILEDQRFVSPLKSFDAAANSAVRASKVIEQLPALIQKERAALAEHLATQVRGVIEDLQKERASVLDALGHERGAAIDAFKGERLALTEELRQQVVALFKNLDEITRRSIEKSSLVATDMVDHFYVRLIQIGVAVLVLSAFLLWLLRRAQRSGLLAGAARRSSGSAGACP